MSMRGQASIGKVHWWSVQEIRGGRYPYLYGGGPDGCRHCKSEDHVAKFCQFGLDGFGQCWGGRREQLIHYYLQRGFNDILTFTPCDLWPMLRGRTLYFSGDSQTQVTFFCMFFLLCLCSETQIHIVPCRASLQL